MLLIHGTAKPAHGRADDLIAAANTMVDATRNDDGCLLYVFVRSLDGDEIINVEIWRDQAALDAHMEHEHTQTFLARIGHLVDGDPVMTITEA